MGSVVAEDLPGGTRPHFAVCFEIPFSIFRRAGTLRGTMNACVVALILLLAVSARPGRLTAADKSDAPTNPPSAEVKLPAGFRYEILAEGDVPEPMDITFAPDGRLWAIGREGQIWMLNVATKQLASVGKLTVDHSDDRGLLGLELHPDFARNGFLFLFYSPLQADTNKPMSRLSRFTVRPAEQGAELVAGSEKILLEFALEKGGQHTGGGIAYHPGDGKLYVTTGDNNRIVDLPKYYADPENRAQNLNDLRGKVLRLNLDGSIPTDNPYYGQASQRGEIFTRGHRQPWRLGVDTVTGNIFLAENGGDRLEDFEEVNLLRSGGNYGWPRVYADNRDMFAPTNTLAGFDPPWLGYQRFDGASCTGAFMYRGATGKYAFPAAFRDVLFYTDYKRKSLRVARLDEKTGRPVKTEGFALNFAGGPVSVRRGPDGAIYVAEYAGWFRGSRTDRLSRIICEQAP